MFQFFIQCLTLPLSMSDIEQSILSRRAVFEKCTLPESSNMPKHRKLKTDDICTALEHIWHSVIVDVTIVHRGHILPATCQMLPTLNVKQYDRYF